jgi:hypothetical protein
MMGSPRRFGLTLLALILWLVVGLAGPDRAFFFMPRPLVPGWPIIALRIG